MASTEMDDFENLRFIKSYLYLKNLIDGKIA